LVDNCYSEFRPKFHDLNARIQYGIISYDVYEFIPLCCRKIEASEDYTYVRDASTIIIMSHVNDRRTYKKSIKKSIK